MKLKGLKEITHQVEKLRNQVTYKIDALDQDGSQWEEKDNYYNDAWMEIDEAVLALKRVAEMKLEGYL